MNYGNLNPFTSDQSRDEAVKNGRKGGKASGRSRRKKADMRKAAQEILSMSTEATVDGELKEVSQAYAIVLNLLKKARDPDDKQAIEAAKTLIQLTGANKSEEENDKLKAQAELTRAKAQAINSGGAGIEIEDLKPLAEMLKNDDDADNSMGTVLEET